MLPIHRIAIPNPFFEGRNSVYLLKGDPLTLIDTGVATDKAFDCLVNGLRELDVDVSEVRRVLLTHKHIDHIGNAWRIQRESGAEVYIHELEQKSLTDVDPTGQRFKKVVEDRLLQWGASSVQRDQGSGPKMPQWKLEACEATPLPDRLSIQFAGSEFEGRTEYLSEPQALGIEVVPTPGHTMGSVCFRLGEILFSGDHVLERISPNIGGGDMRSRGMLGHFLNSLERVKSLGELHIHPGHGEPFLGLKDRCDRLAKHHDIRLRQALKAVQDGSTSVAEVARKLYGNLKDFHIVLGCAEANAHLEYLVDEGKIIERQHQFFPA